jgi:hypothetical protein
MAMDTSEKEKKSEPKLQTRHLSEAAGINSQREINSIL